MATAGKWFSIGEIGNSFAWRVTPLQYLILKDQGIWWSLC